MNRLETSRLDEQTGQPRRQGRPAEIWRRPELGPDVGGTAEPERGALKEQWVGFADGGRVERELEFDFSSMKELVLSLRVADFTTASRVSEAINIALAQEVALAKDSRTIVVRIPPAYRGRAAELVAAIESIQVDPDRKARVVINERSGTVVIGELVQVRSVAISQGNLSIEIVEKRDVSQPLPFTLGGTVKNKETEIKITEENGKLTVLPDSISIGELAKALNAMGVSPRDLASIFQALKGAGAIDAEIIVQ